MNEELSLSDARMLAKYFEKTIRNNEKLLTEKEKIKAWQGLSYCRCIILKKSSGKFNQLS